MARNGIQQAFFRWDNGGLPFELDAIGSTATLLLAIVLTGGRYASDTTSVLSP